MKKLSELVAEDFPGINPVRFEEWKQAQVSAGRNGVIVIAIIGVLGIISIFVFKVSGFIPAILMIVLIAVSNIIVNGEANRLAKELGITKDMVKKATQS
jgi:hypothetical protein